MSEEVDATVLEWGERLDHADALFEAGNVTRAASLAHAVEVEAEHQRKRAAVGSASECMRVLKRARAALERFECAAAIDDEDEEDDHD